MAWQQKKQIRNQQHQQKQQKKKTYDAVGGNGLELELGLSDGEVLAEEVVGRLADISEGNGDGGEGHCIRSEDLVKRV